MPPHPLPDHRKRMLRLSRLPTLRIAMTGWSASGKTVYARLLAQALDCAYVSGSAMLLQRLEQPADADWIDARAALQAARHSSAADRDADAALVARVRESDRVLADSWTAPWLLGDDVVKLWIDCGEETRVKNATLGFGPLSDAQVRRVRDGLREKDADSVALFRELHGFTLGPDPLVFDAVVDATPYFGHVREKWPQERRVFLDRLVDEVHRAAQRKGLLR